MNCGKHAKYINIARVYINYYAGPWDYTENLQSPCTELATRGSESVMTCWGSVSECGMGIGVGFFTETASFLRNPRVPCNSSYEDLNVYYATNNYFNQLQANRYKSTGWVWKVVKKIIFSVL